MMAETKIFAGPRVRRVRNGLGLTQTAMAEALSISPSYLNLIERNQRPLTVQLLLKLASSTRSISTICKAKAAALLASCGKSLQIRCLQMKFLHRRSG